MPTRPDPRSPRDAGRHALRPADASPPKPGRRRSPASTGGGAPRGWPAPTDASGPRRSLAPPGGGLRSAVGSPTGGGLRRPSTSEVLLLWAPTALGVAVALTIIAAVAVTRGSGAGPAPRASIDYAWTPPVAYQPPVAATTRAPSPSLIPATIPPLSPTPTVRRTTTRPRTTPPPPPPPLTGRYGVVDTYRDGFIGEILVTNPSATARGWTVRLQFGRDVGRLHTFWVDGAPPPEVDRQGTTYVFTSRAPVAARGKVALRVQFQRWGRDISPSACAVNGSACQ
ncbi:hypothetical protein [Phytohabitans kaempferiae]|uniref:CBM2 domain-containing protein n=1 Tax=Phytohabitans kaempferiae TaxID=1620943 RepID=A0ABV6M4I3_9ACTN